MPEQQDTCCQRPFYLIVLGRLQIPDFQEFGGFLIVFSSMECWNCKIINLWNLSWELTTKPIPFSFMGGVTEVQADEGP